MCKSSCTQNKGAGGWLLVPEQNLVNGRFPFTRLRLHSFCPALELTSEYLHCNQRVNHTGAARGGRARRLALLLSAKKWRISASRRSPALSDTVFTLGAQRNALGVCCGESRGRLAFA